MGSELGRAKKGEKAFLRFSKPRWERIFTLLKRQASTAGYVMIHDIWNIGNSGAEFVRLRQKEVAVMDRMMGEV